MQQVYNDWDGLDRDTQARMPWHDVHMAVCLCTPVSRLLSVARRLRGRQHAMLHGTLGKGGITRCGAVTLAACVVVRSMCCCGRIFGCMCVWMDVAVSVYVVVCVAAIICCCVPLGCLLWMVCMSIWLTFMCISLCLYPAPEPDRASLAGS